MEHRAPESSHEISTGTPALEQRMHALMDINARLMTTLNQHELLMLIMRYARDLLEVEATSVWEVDESEQVLILRAATGDFIDNTTPVTVPVGKGIVGQVVAQGKLQLVDDVRKVSNHYQQLDRQSGFVTRSILCVPLRTPRINLGPARGSTEEAVIGAIQALNKLDGSDFTQEDIVLLEAFAHQAATALQTARLYDGMRQLFHDTIAIVAKLVDARDPYTRGHSQRVANTAVVIAEELGMDREAINEIEIGGILHDVGKIGVPDSILNKRGRLSNEEYRQIQQHPVIGYQAMQASKAICQQHPSVLKAILEHHRRLDGSGYPDDQTSEPISQVGRILAVADVFDALTSDRPYRGAWSAEDAIDYLWERAGTEFDAECVAALARGRERGRVVTQAEWEARQNGLHLEL